uniref:XIAP associated factor 1 n=1 Tax=Sphenodon punctatus TaxID=8508 RepID=A0A8D0G3B8_SPHPU
MKVKEERSSRPTMEETVVVEEEERFCKNCKRDVLAVNFSLHEAHCTRFLAICPECDMPVALKEMKEHVEKAHAKSNECSERVTKCGFCELDMPSRQLQEHVDICGSRTERCWDCRKYVMYKDLESHKELCQNRAGLSNHASKTNLCHVCHKWFPDDQYLQHLNDCNPLPKLLGALSTQSPTEASPPHSPLHLPSPPSSPLTPKKTEKDVRPKRKEKELSAISKPSLKPPKNKMPTSRPAFTSTLVPTMMQSLEDTGYDKLLACSHCNILLPSPTLRKHEKKCLHSAPLHNMMNNPRRSPRGHKKEEESF